MLRGALVKKGVLMDGDFRVRAPEVSRVEGFSDAAFAFALTLLVISLEVPRDFDGLLDVMRGVPAFAVCFAMLIWVWVAHYKYFRRYGLEDRITIALNSVLLFVVMLYVYPLKFVFTNFIGMLTGVQPSNSGAIRNNQVGDLFVIYGIGFVLVFGVLGLMNARAYKFRDRLQLDELERLMTRAEIARCFGLACVGAASAGVALLLHGRGAAGLAGMAYGLIGVVEFAIGWRFGRKRDALVKSISAPAGLRS